MAANSSLSGLSAKAKRAVGSSAEVWNPVQTSSLPFPVDAQVVSLHREPPTGVKTPRTGALDMTDHSCVLTGVICLNSSLRGNHRFSRETLQIPVYSSHKSINIGLKILLQLSLCVLPENVIDHSFEAVL